MNIITSLDGDGGRSTPQAHTDKGTSGVGIEIPASDVLSYLAEMTDEMALLALRARQRAAAQYLTAASRHLHASLERARCAAGPPPAARKSLD